MFSRMSAEDAKNTYEFPTNTHLRQQYATWEDLARAEGVPLDPVLAASPAPSQPPARTPAQPSLSATQRWEHAVAEKMAAGATRGEAISALVSEEPELHETWLAEANSRPAPLDDPAPSAIVPFPQDLQSTDPAVTLFTRAVSRHMEKGLTRGQAIRQTASEVPAVHRAYVAAIQA